MCVRAGMGKRGAGQWVVLVLMLMVFGYLYAVGLRIPSQALRKFYFNPFRCSFANLRSFIIDSPSRSLFYFIFGYFVCLYCNKMLRYVVALAALTQLGLCTPSAKEFKAANIPSGFSHCIFYDDFSTSDGHLPDSSKWALDLGTSYPGGPEHWGTGEIQTYTKDKQNIHITSRNTLKITPIRSDHNTWTSARLETTPDWDFACARGQRMRVEARIKLGDNPADKQLGIWPAFWALGSEYRDNYQNWPAVGEIDILETVNGERKIWHVVHCGTNPGGICDEPNGIGHVSEPFTRGEWHTIAWEVDRRKYAGQESMSWYIDGEKQWTLTEGDVKDDDAWCALAGNSKMVLLNVAVGGGFPNGVYGKETPTDDTLDGNGASMEVDYVAVYTKGWF